MDEKCVSCKTNYVGKSGVMCNNCWEWFTEKVTMEDINMMIAMLHHREPDNKHAKEICVYIIADNYMQGKAKLVK